MAKSARKRVKGTKPTKKVRKTTKGRAKAAEYISSLLELHKLQGILLIHLKEEVQ